MSTIDAEVVIVGGGIAGAATAYHLRGRKSVIILEREETPGQHSTGRNAAIIREICVGPEIAPVMEEGAAALQRGDLAEYIRCGIVLAGQEGPPIAEHFPDIPGNGGWHEPGGVVDVAGLLTTYLQGSDLRCGIEVTGWQRVGDIIEVETSKGTLRTHTLVNAAGPWAGVFGDLPLTPRNRTIFITAPIEGINAALPVVWYLREGLYFRPESGGLLMSVCDQVDAAPGDYAFDPDVIELLVEKLEAHAPRLQEVSISHHWVGQRTFAPDEGFVIGHDPRKPGLFHVGALGGHGVTASFAVGRIAADAIVRGDSDEIADDLRPERLLSSVSK